MYVNSDIYEFDGKNVAEMTNLAGYVAKDTSIDKLMLDVQLGKISLADGLEFTEWTRLSSWSRGRFACTKLF
jgi:hypothetical protein